MTQSGFDISLATSFDAYWRYNVALMCGCFDESGSRIGFVSTEDTVAEPGANLPQPPRGHASPRHVRLTTPPCASILLYVYLIPHTLPSGREVADTTPFGLTVRIASPDGTVRQEEFRINQWSGASLEIRHPDTPPRP